jgi:two-component system, chemotaxis family, sensor kinase CheA
MDVVKQRINELRGSLSIKNQLGKGVAFHIQLPLSRSIIDGLLVNVADTRYVVPLHLVDRIDRLPYQSLLTDLRINKSVVVNGEPRTVYMLRQMFSHDTPLPKNADVISMTIGGLPKGLAVDSIAGKMQVVLKPLGDVYQSVDFISGSTILGDGTIALVLDPQRFFGNGIDN